ncbi:hypothetical protein Pcinc_019279 [Petrolisthes cinctipes]|uniref:IGFBP N-terminal domain-containing protein n=1 Tax=Petrolisthes cinctipes TaxID=88211 RepID=A0AAE1KLF2_PETCI|nr:hypothetical protein Pcinc_019279 [Petrolisthes cinctipes]
MRTLATLIICFVSAVCRVWGLSCLPCREVTCEMPAEVSRCSWGLVLDMCGCCYVCGKGPGESCGGQWAWHGRCGRGLDCRRPSDINEARGGGKRRRVEAGGNDIATPLQRFYCKLTHSLSPTEGCLDPPGNNDVAALIVAGLEAARDKFSTGMPNLGIPPIPYDLGNANGFMDVIMSEVDQAILNQGLDPAPLPDTTLSLGQVSDNKVNIVPGELAGCPKLKELDLKGNPLSDRRFKKLVESERCIPRQVLDYIKQHCPLVKGDEGKKGKKGKGGKGKQKEKDEISCDTTDILVEVTSGTSLTKAKEVMNALVFMTHKLKLNNNNNINNTASTLKEEVAEGKQDLKEEVAEGKQDLKVERNRVILKVEQVKVEEEETGQLRVLYPSRVDLTNHSDNIRVVMPGKY